MTKTEIMMRNIRREAVVQSSRDSQKKEWVLSVEAFEDLLSYKKFIPLPTNMADTDITFEGIPIKVDSRLPDGTALLRNKTEVTTPSLEQVLKEAEEI